MVRERDIFEILFPTIFHQVIDVIHFFNTFLYSVSSFNVFSSLKTDIFLTSQLFVVLFGTNWN